MCSRLNGICSCIDRTNRSQFGLCHFTIGLLLQSDGDASCGVNYDVDAVSGGVTQKK